MNPFFLIDYMNRYSYNNVMKLDSCKVKEIESLLKVLADSTRLLIMLCLLNEKKCKHPNNCNGCKQCVCMIEKCVSEIMNETNKSQSLISHQLKVLRKAELVKIRKVRQKVYYSLKDNCIKELLNIVIGHVEEK